MNDPHKKYRLGTVSKNILMEDLNQFHGGYLALNSNVDQDTFGKVTKHNKHDSQEVSTFPAGDQKATRNGHDITCTTHTTQIDPQKKHRLGTVIQILLLGANLTLSSDVNQDTYMLVLH